MKSKFKWHFPIITRIIEIYKELGFIKFTLWALFVWLGLKILIINTIGILFFDIEAFPIISEILNGIKGYLL